MPPRIFALLIMGVICAAGLTLWMLTSVGPISLMIALPLCMSAALALKLLHK